MARQDPVDRLRAEHPGEQIYYGVSFNWDGPPTHSVAEAFFGLHLPDHGLPVLWVRTRHTAWIRADEPVPLREHAPKRTRKPSRAELERRLATAERKAAEAVHAAELARAALMSLDEAR